MENTEQVNDSTWLDFINTVARGTIDIIRAGQTPTYGNPTFVPLGGAQRTSSNNSGLLLVLVLVLVIVMMD